MSNFYQNTRKYLNYKFDTKSFNPEFRSDHLSDHALETAKSIRGYDNPPTIVIHGVMKRSGTVYVGELLSLHPDLYSYPNQVWEIPFLPLTGSIMDLQKDFFQNYEPNIGKIGENDFLPIFGASFIRYFYSLVPEGRRLLLKIPSVQYLNHFYSVFPDENMLLLIRDGRDVVTSTIKTWPQIRFSDACRRWDRSVRMILACQEHYAGQNGYWLARFEDAVNHPENFVEEACKYLNLDPGRYPFDKVQSLMVIGSSTTRKEGKKWVQKTKDFNPIGRWQQWSGWKKFTFKKIAGESLIKLGYCDKISIGD